MDRPVEDSKHQKAGFILSLKALNNKIVFYPTFSEIESTILETFNVIMKASCDIPRFENTLFTDIDENISYLKPIVLPDILEQMQNTVKCVLEKQSKHPIDYIKVFHQFLYLINGEAEMETNNYIQEDHKFEDFASRVRFFDNLCNETLSKLPKQINLGMFELHCEDLIINLTRKTNLLREQILKKMSSDHQNMNRQLCQQYENISQTALSSPDNTEELVELKEKVAKIRTYTMVEKEQELNQAAQRLVFLSDYLQFTTSEMKLNTKTFQWHAKMPKVFEEHEAIMREKTTDYQKALKLRRERFIEELENSNNQVSVFRRPRVN